MATREFYRRHLPHYQPADALYAVTLRLAGSLPLDVVHRLRYDHEARLNQLVGLPDGPAKRELYHQVSMEHVNSLDALLHSAQCSPRYLEDHRIAEIVSGALHYNDGTAYDLLASTIMPNHIHLVCATGTLMYSSNVGAAKERRPIGAAEKEFPLTGLLASIKKFSARRANQVLGRSGPFWQEESYDHLLKTPEELEHAIWYVLMNPVKAHLIKEWQEWPWTYCKPGLILE